MDDNRLFEKVCLEGFQSGLSWLTILRKRENFRRAFDNFNFHKIANYTEDDVVRLLGDTGIVRNRRKIEAVINNAQRAVEMAARNGTLAAFFWDFAPPRSKEPKVPMPATSPESIELSVALKNLGWKFVGPTNMYAFMQAMGLVNDHEIDCVVRSQAG